MQETAVTTDNDPGCRPSLANSLDKQLQDGPGMFGSVNVGWTQVRTEQMFAAENVQRQKTVVPVITVKKPAFLISVKRVIGRVEVESDFLRRLIV